MLTKLGVTALLGTIGAASLGGTAAAAEPCGPVAAPVQQVAYGYGNGYAGGYGYRESGYQRMMRERRERAMEHARWLHEHRGYGRGGNRW